MGYFVIYLFIILLFIIILFIVQLYSTTVSRHWGTVNIVVKVKRKRIYITPLLKYLTRTQGAQVRITQCYLQITPYLPLPRKHSPDGASQTEVADIWLQPTTHLSTRKDERFSWPRWLVTYWDRLPARRQSLIPVLTGLDVEQLRWSRPTRYRYTKPPTSRL